MYLLQAKLVDRRERNIQNYVKKHHKIMNKMLKKEKR